MQFRRHGGLARPGRRIRSLDVPADGAVRCERDYGFGELDALVPAYAASIHKSQGSEYPAVVIRVMTQHYAMLQRNLLYTGVTRGPRGGAQQRIRFDAQAV